MNYKQTHERLVQRTLKELAADAKRYLVREAKALAKRATRLSDAKLIREIERIDDDSLGLELVRRGQGPNVRALAVLQREVSKRPNVLDLLAVLD